MSILSIILTAIGLAMDAFAVSLTIGMSVPEDEKSKAAIKSGVYFGLFQGIMPLIGWLLGIKFTKYIQSFAINPIQPTINFGCRTSLIKKIRRLEFHHIRCVYVSS